VFFKPKLRLNINNVETAMTAADNENYLINLGETVVREERELLLNILNKEYMVQTKHPSQAAAEWRLRKKRENAIFNRLSELGAFAPLACGGLLVTYRQTVLKPERFSNWRKTLEESPPFARLNPVQQGQLKGAKTRSWTRLEKGIQALGRMICLSIKDLDDPDLLSSFAELKVWLIGRSFASDKTLDDSLNYIKWLGKSCQYVLLKSIPQRPEIEPFLVNGTLAPFTGKLSFMSDLILSFSRRKTPLTYNQARILAQLGNLPRSLPYPSRDMIRQSLKDTVKVFTSEYHPPEEALQRYREGLTTITQDLGFPKENKSHVSLISNGVLEASRKDGGRSAILVQQTKLYTSTELTEEIIDDLTGLFDQFGTYLISPATAALAKQMLGLSGPRENFRVFKITPTLGDILFVEVHELAGLWEQTLNQGENRRVPPKLGHLLNLTASKLVLTLGEYEPSHEVRHGVLCFNTENTVFHLTGQLRVKANVSIEAGLKTRLVTACMAAFAHLSQIPSNFMRDYLSSDPFHRVGFQEADKLWEVLKEYKNRRTEPQSPNRS
jgi:hypothetical protein